MTPRTPLLGSTQVLEVDLDLAGERNPQIIAVGEALPDEVGLLRPENFRPAAPDLDVDDLRQGGDPRGERASPTLSRRRIARLCEDALERFPSTSRRTSSAVFCHSHSET